MLESATMADNVLNTGFICTKQQVDLGFGDKIALRWVSAKKELTDFTYADLERLSNKVANLLQDLGIKEGQRVFIILPKTPEVYYSFLGALKVKLIVGTLFSNFGSEALLDRLGDGQASVIITKTSLLTRIQQIWDQIPSLKKVILVDAENHINEKILSLPALMEQASESFAFIDTCQQTPSVLHYTSGSTGKPKGVQHVHGSVKAIRDSFDEIMQPEKDDIYWCTADPAWVTGTSYGIIAPFCHGLTQIQYGGGFDPEDWFSLLEREKVNILYTAPTVLRMMMQYDDSLYQRFSLVHLHKIFSVGEPLNPSIYNWSVRVLGKEIFDTWFQTETGSIMIANRPGLPIKPGSMGKPLSYISAEIMDESQVVQEPNMTGHLCVKQGWSSMFVDYLNQNETYKSKFSGSFYYSGDLAYKDEEGYFWFIGRADDVINTAGHLVSPFEVESAVLEIPGIIDVGVVGAPDELIWEKVVAFVKLQTGVEWTKNLELKIRIHVSNRVSPMASPKEIVVVDDIPKNRSGKVMRRVLKANYLNQSLGDISTMEEK